jgi:hypothetical protein
VPVTAAPPAGVEKHARESDAVRSGKIMQRQSEMERRSQSSAQRNKTREK